MSQNVPTHYVQQYRGTLDLLLQQKQSIMRGLVTEAPYKGKAAAPVDQVGSLTARRVTTRYPVIGHMDVPTDRRWVYPLDSEVPILIDHFDTLRLMSDPKNAYTMAVHAAANREIDDIIIPAFFADAKTGQEGGTTTSFPAANQISVDLGGTASGLNVKKIKRGKRRLRENLVDPSEPIYCAVSAEQMENLMDEVQATSGDFVRGRPMEEGEIKYFYGTNFVITERLKTDASGYRRVPMWVKSGMHLGVWENIVTDMSQRKDLSGLPWQVYTYFTFGATRLEENKTIEIPCAEA